MDFCVCTEHKTPHTSLPCGTPHAILENVDCAQASVFARWLCQHLGPRPQHFLAQQLEMFSIGLGCSVKGWASHHWESVVATANVSSCQSSERRNFRVGGATQFHQGFGSAVRSRKVTWLLQATVLQLFDWFAQCFIVKERHNTTF